MEVSVWSAGVFVRVACVALGVEVTPERLEDEEGEEV